MAIYLFIYLLTYSRQKKSSLLQPFFSTTTRHNERYQPLKKPHIRNELRLF